MRGSASPASARPVVDLGRPPCERVVLVVGLHRLVDALGEPCLPDEHHELVGQAQQRLAAHPLGRRPPTPPRARARACRPGSRRGRPRRRRRAPSDRPTRTTHGARRPASQRPSAERVTHSAATLCEASPATSRSAQRSGCSSIAMPSSSCAVVDQPRRDPVVARRAARPAARGSPRRPPRRALARARSAPRASARVICSIAHGPRARISGARGCSARRLGHGTKASQCGATAGEHRLARVKHPPAQALGVGLSRISSPAPSRRCAAAPALAERLGHRSSASSSSRSRSSDARAAAPRVRAAGRARRDLLRATTHARASHALGKSYVDVVRGFRGRFEHPPDFVARPRDESDVERVLEWCSAERVAAIPFGGGTSVVGGVTPEVAAAATTASSRSTCARSIACSRSIRSRARRGSRRARPGRRSRRSSAEHGLTLRHFPQSFEFSTLGGWIATRAAGHFATRLDAHRGLRRVGARDHAGRRVGVAPAAGLRRGRQPRPDARRLGGRSSA